MRYIIGIDLGTTNSCVAYVDTTKPSQPIHQLRIPQLVKVGYVESLPTLPSVCYLSEEGEWIVGSFALHEGAKIPTRQVQSAKSWLCHSAAHRRDKILPLEASDASIRISPVEASAKYLQHIKEAWNRLMAGEEAEFTQQEIVLTVPASFDEVARTLTVEAARQAGLVHMTLIEEPQAAFYSWIAQNEKEGIFNLPAGALILVVDVGGGTTDFSLIEVQSKEGKPSFQRMAVGDHLLLGGDNMDAAVAHHLEKKMQLECTTGQWVQLKHEARKAKEHLLEGGQSYRVVLQGTGSHVVGGSHAIEVTQKEVVDLLLPFFKCMPLEEALCLPKKCAIRAMGLPYEEEPSVIKHMANFLKQAGLKQPDYVLFNGGALKPDIFQKAILEALESWFPEKKVKALKSYSLDLAVARGASYYGKVRRGAGVAIGGGSARGFYLALTVQGVERALTLLPRGSEEGNAYESEQTFQVLPNTPVSFQVYSSHVRLRDAPGSLVELNPEQMQPLPPIHTLLRHGKSNQKIPVHLAVELTAIGTLQLAIKAVNSPHQWALEFQLRTAEGQEDSLVTLAKTRRDETFDASFLLPAREFLRALYQGTSQVKSSKVVEKLEEHLGKQRKEWPPSILRGLAEEVLALASRRRQSAELEGRWWNLAGFLLRPGFGYPLDDFKLKELWKVILADLQARRSDEVYVQNLICYRRVAGGLSKGQQQQLAPDLLTKKGALIETRDLNLFQEKVRALGAFELLEPALKEKLGQAFLERLIRGSATNAEIWALGRLGARRLLYGGVGCVIDKEVVQAWIERLLNSEVAENQKYMLLSAWARKTDLREIDVSDATLQRIFDRSSQLTQLERLKTLLKEQSRLTESEQEHIFGESLPLGLSLE